MKKIVYLLCGFLLFACQPKGPAVWKGKLDMGEYSQVELFVKTPDTDTINVDKNTLEFSHLFEVDSPKIVSLFGVVGEGKNRFPMRQMLYVEPGREYSLKIELKNRKTCIVVEEKGVENKALIEYNSHYAEKIGQLWKNMPSAETFQDSLFQVYSESMKLIAKHSPNKFVQTYLCIQAYLDYFSAYEGLVYQFTRQQQQIPEQNHEQLPACFEVLDHPLALNFYNLHRCIYNQLKGKANEPEDQIQLLQKWFKTKAIRDAMEQYICQLFVDRFPYCEENYERLKKLSTALLNQEEILKTYQNKRFATLGSPWPDLVFEDQAGKQHRLSELKGKYVYIDLWASWCAPCCAEVPHLKKLEKELNNPNVVFVSISIDSNRDAWLKKMEQLDMHGNQWILTDENFVKMLNVRGIPHFLLYDKEGTLMQYRADRPSSGERLKKMLAGLK